VWETIRDGVESFFPGITLTYLRGTWAHLQDQALGAFLEQQALLIAGASLELAAKLDTKVIMASWAHVSCDYDAKVPYYGLTALNPGTHEKATTPTQLVQLIATPSAPTPTLAGTPHTLCERGPRWPQQPSNVIFLELRWADRALADTLRVTPWQLAERLH
jgi:hypothetical protein